jgi:hypothetical protein
VANAKAGRDEIDARNASRLRADGRQQWFPKAMELPFGLLKDD